MNDIPTIPIAIGGCNGRMGQRLIALADADPRFTVCGRFDVEHVEEQSPFDVMIEFSLPDGTAHFADLAVQRGCGLVSGTTGLGPEQQARLDAAAAQVPVLRADNFSLGINLLLHLVPQVARQLPADYDIEIIETHHTQKVDAPSGTASALLHALQRSTQRGDSDIVHGRLGRTGTKPPREIGVHAVRSGNTVGRHTVLFGGPEESISIQHEATNRDTFARGALAAAAWLRRRPPGMYGMGDVLGIE